jgi:Ni/Fe-hydrogenase subunit HybB-like protein
MSPDRQSSKEAALGYPTELFTKAETPESITTQVAAIPLFSRPTRSWYLALALGVVLVFMLLVAVTVLFIRGIGIWGVNVPVGWGFAIVNFVWWIGIGHAGTFISAILLLLSQNWRNSINRFAEAMTIFAVACAGIFPLLHLGRPWVFYWLAPYPDTMGLWPQFRSPLVWDVFAVSTYFTVSLVFWFTGLIPDFATLRDSATSPIKQRIYGVLALGWRGSAVHWQRYKMLYLLLAGLSTPLVLSVHSVVSFDFAVSILPGWHSTIFPPYFVAGAIFSGFAMVLNIVIPVRRIYHLENLITERHLNNMAGVMLATGLMVAYGYLMEWFFAWFSGDLYEQFMMSNRMYGPYAWAFWLLMLCNIVVPQFLWSRRVRTHPLALFTVALFINVGMWLERFVIVIVSLHRDLLTSSWRMYVPTVWDWATYIGTMGLFLVCLLLFVRFVPMISMAEMRELTVERGRKTKSGEEEM